MNNPRTSIRAVIWDMDGVIADTAQQHFLSWQAAFQKRGTKFTEDDFLHHFGQRNDTIIHSIKGAGVAPAEIEAIAEDKEDYFRRNIVNNLKPFPGVIRLLKILKANDLLAAVGSSAPRENICLILDQLKIADYFQAVVYGQEVLHGKPSPDVFLLAAQKLGAVPSNCIVVEDAVAGVAAAKSAGMRCIAVTNTHPALKLSQADLVVESLEEVSLEDVIGLLTRPKC